MHLHLVTLHVKRSPQSVPLAAAFLQSSIAAHFHPTSPIRVTTADYICGTSVEIMAAKIVETGAQLVGFSLYVWNRAEIAQLAQKLKKLSPQLILLGGGAEATADPEGIMAEAPFDYLMIGEGEGPLPELLQRLRDGRALNDLPGLICRQGDAIIPAPLQHSLSLEKIPSPWLAGLLDAYIPDGVLWQLARGCSFACEFCFDGMGTRAVRRFPLERVAAELDYLVRHGVRQVFVLDSTFNQDLKRAKRILKLIQEKAPGVHFHFEIRYEFLDAESAQLFAAISCSLQIGLQSASPQVLKGVGRIFAPKEFKCKIALLNNAGATFGFDLIYGLPGDSLPDFKKSLDFALSQYPNQLDIFPLAILPGTPLASKCGELQLLHLPHPPYTILTSPTFTASDLAAARRLANACDIFYSRGKAVAWFNTIAAGLKLSPSSLLLAFADWLLVEIGYNPDPTDYADESIWSLQRRFIIELFCRHQVEKLVPMALDLVDYHYYHAAIVQSSPPRIPKAKDLAKIDVLRTPLRQSASARLATFNYDIEELIQLGEPQLSTAAARLKPVRSFAILYAAHGEICTETLPQAYFQLIEKLDGQCPAEKIAANLGLSSGEARKFLQIALQEGIISPAKM